MPVYKPVFPARQDGGEEEEGWFLTFGDLMALLLCFFILIAAISSFHMDKYKSISETLAKAMGGRIDQTVTDLEALKEKITALLESPELAGDIQLRALDKGVAVDIRGGLLFPSASADLNEDAKPALKALGQRLIEADFRVKVEGHTDDQPITSQVYPSNWELAAARAGAVARYLISEGLTPSRLTILGYGETRPRGGNDTEEGRALNRRVSLIITPGAD